MERDKLIEALDTTGCDVVFTEKDGYIRCHILTPEAVKHFDHDSGTIEINDTLMLEIDILEFIENSVPHTWVCGILLDDGTLGYIKPDVAH